jgi:putative transposase
MMSYPEGTGLQMEENMASFRPVVRAGIVTHPSEWPFCGYNEVQNPRQRYALIDYDNLIDLFGVGSRDEFKKRY